MQAKRWSALRDHVATGERFGYQEFRLLAASDDGAIVLDEENQRLAGDELCQEVEYLWRHAFANSQNT